MANYLVDQKTGTVGEETKAKMNVGDKVYSGGGVYVKQADGSFAKESGSTSTSNWNDVVASYNAANNATGTTSGTGAIADLAQRAGNFARETQAEAEAEQQAAQKQKELENYLKQQYMANTQAALARLKSAYERGLAGYNTQEEGLGGLYDAARNRAAAQTALERMNFNERAAASGLNSGTSGQAELARSAVQQSTLAGIDRAQADAQSQIDLAKNQLAANYEQAVAETQASYDSQLAQDLYQEMLRQNAESDAALEAKLAEAQSASKPTLTAAQTLQALKSGVVNDTTKAAYEYYYGQPYDDGTQTSTVVSPVYTPGTGYNNGGLSGEQVKQLQGLLGVSQDGYWGPKTQAAANAMWGTTDADTAFGRSGIRSGNALSSGAAMTLAARAGSTAEAQVAKLIELYNAGQITEQQLKDLQYSILNPNK